MILDGKKAAEHIKKSIANEVERLNSQILLALIIVGEDPASMVYVRNKEKACEEVGINVRKFALKATATEKELTQIIEECNIDPTVNGILVQLPLPSHINTSAVINSIDPNKDVDGLHIKNQGKLFEGMDTIYPATPKGVISLLKINFIDIAGKNVVIVGRSNLVGKPLALMFLKENATITIAHSKTQNIKEITRRADILAVAVGIPKYITADMVKKDAVVIDIGINKVEGKVVGDVDYENVSEIASFITPVPKGIGPMTIASLLENIIFCYKKQNKII